VRVWNLTTKQVIARWDLATLPGIKETPQGLMSVRWTGEATELPRRPLPAFFCVSCEPQAAAAATLAVRSCAPQAAAAATLAVSRGVVGISQIGWGRCAAGDLHDVSLT
jgi:hypothetical protein